MQEAMDQEHVHATDVTIQNHQAAVRMYLNLLFQRQDVNIAFVLQVFTDVFRVNALALMAVLLM